MVENFEDAQTENEIKMHFKARYKRKIFFQSFSVSVAIIMLLIEIKK